MKANQFAKNEEGVSAVIGVILMVAITVILAAVIAAFVFGMVGNVNQKKNPAFTVKRIDSTHVQITLNDLGGATAINDLKISQPTGTTAFATPADAAATQSVGGTLTIDNFPDVTTHLVITGSVDGNPQVIVDTSI